ncbi:MAG: branched-chain amino acid ABC transporter permease [Nocardioidaceae bacterium]|nr:branched-chain amino acid ABC transporter permease [Nocardioidaceae bacterium]
MSAFVQSLIDACSLGALYGLEALAVGLLFGVVRVANFALGTVVTTSAYALYAGRDAGLAGAVGLALVVAVVLCLAMERLVFRPLRTAPVATLFIASFAVAFTLEKTLLLAFGPDQRSFVFDRMPSGVVSVGGYYVTRLSLLTIVLVGVLLAALVGLLRGTSFGIRMRAASDDFAMARLVGVRANAVTAGAFAITGVMSVVVALVLSAQVGGVTPSLGTNVIVFALLGAVVGGLDRLGGAATGGFVVGATLSLLSSWLPDRLAGFDVSFLVAVVIALLLLRPGGLVRAGTMKERV